MYQRDIDHESWILRWLEPKGIRFHNVNIGLQFLMRIKWYIPINNGYDIIILTSILLRTINIKKNPNFLKGKSWNKQLLAWWVLLF